ncbi:MAG: hypothetical protein WA906_04435, partial [Pacificimonas sp.]
MTIEILFAGKEPGAERCHSIATDDATPSGGRKIGRREAVALRVGLAASRPLTGPSGPLSR